MSKSITSLQNVRVKEVVRLGKRSFRDEKRLTVVEGGREISLALSVTIQPRQLFLCPPLLDDAGRSALESCAELIERGDTELVEVTPDVYAKMAYRGGSGGLLAVVPYIDQTLQEATVRGRALALVVEGAEKPGNLGAVLRTADAAGVDFVIACGDGTDIYNPNAVRASLGALFTVPTYQTGVEETIAWLRIHGFSIVVSSPDAPHEHYLTDLRNRTAIVAGSEAHGITGVWADVADHNVRIPMFGQVDSLNLSASVAILVYEAVRQRQTDRTDSRFD